MNKIRSLFLLLLISIFFIMGCKKDVKKDYKIVCTIFPEYDWVCEVLGDEKDSFDVVILQKSKADLHNYEPSVADITDIMNSDLFIYVGGESDDWVEDVLKQVKNDDFNSINLLETLGDRRLETVHKEGMMEDHEDHEEDHHEHEYDEHVWLSLKNAIIFTKKIAEEIGKIDLTKKDIYQKNANEYIEKLEKLDLEYSKTISSSVVKTLIFGDRFPFLYLFNDYNLDYYAAFSGCSAETEATFETMVFLTKKIDELQLQYIFKIDGSTDKICKTIIDNSKMKNQKILVLNSIQSTTSKESTSYLSIMDQNLKVIASAING